MKAYESPVVYKIEFDYHIQTAKSQCNQLVANETNGVGYSTCEDEGSTPIYVGLDEPAYEP